MSNSVLLLDPVVSRTQQGSINWHVCDFVYTISVVTMLWSHKLVIFFRTFTQRWHWGWSLPGCLSSSVVLLHPKLRRNRH